MNTLFKSQVSRKSSGWNREEKIPKTVEIKAIGHGKSQNTGLQILPLASISFLVFKCHKDQRGDVYQDMAVCPEEGSHSGLHPTRNRKVAVLFRSHRVVVGIFQGIFSTLSPSICYCLMSGVGLVHPLPRGISCMTGLLEEVEASPRAPDTC